MTDKTKMTNLESYTELSVQIATLEAKVDKLLELAMKNDQLLDTQYVIDQDIRFTGAPPGHGASFIGVLDYLTDKSDDEIFLEENK